MNAELIATFIGQMVLYGGGSAAITFLLFQHLGKKWIENKFSQRLEQLKHDQALELQRLRVEVDSILSGTIRMQEQEFKVLPEAWKKLTEAHRVISWIVSPTQSYQDLDSLNDTQLREFLVSSELSESQKEEVRDSNNKLVTYRRIIVGYRLEKAKIAFGDLQNYVAYHGIFLEPKIKERFSDISNTLWSALVAKEIGHEHEDWELQSRGWKTLKDETDPVYREIEEMIQSRLQSHSQTMLRS